MFYLNSSSPAVHRHRQSVLQGSVDYANSFNLLAIQYYNSQQFTPTPAYLQLLKNEFSAEKRLENFHTYVNIWATADINKWLSNNTNFFYEQFYADYFTILTKMVVANGEYLHGTWYWPILPDSVHLEDWEILSSGEKVKVEMMNFFGMLNYSAFDDGQLVQIPFRDNGLSLYAFLPDLEKLAAADSFSSLFATIPLKERIAKMSYIGAFMKFPKLANSSSVGANGSSMHGQSVKSELQNLGITDAFQIGLADFSGIDGQKNLNLNDVLHRATLQWDEKTASGVAGSGGDVAVPPSIVVNKGASTDDDLGAGGGVFPTPPEINLTFNRAFLFLICDTNGGDDAGKTMTLFAGVIHDPRANH